MIELIVYSVVHSVVDRWGRWQWRSVQNGRCHEPLWRTENYAEKVSLFYVVVL